MVERFSKTMLTAYVSDQQHDWDKHLPYVVMAYRSAVGYTPNILMLGCKVSTLLELMYELSSGMKPSKVHDYVWKLRERLEEAYRYTRQISKQSMMRQKKYYDQNLVSKNILQCVSNELKMAIYSRKGIKLRRKSVRMHDQRILISTENESLKQL